MNEVEIITIDELKGLNTDLTDLDIRKAVSSLSKKGFLYRLKRGTYLNCPEGDLVVNNIERIALGMYNGYIGFSSALKHYRLIDYETFTTFVITKKIGKTIQIGEYSVKYVSLGDKGLGMVNDEGIWVSDLEKTLFDCFYKPQYSGGYPVLSKAIFEAEGVDWNKFIRYVKKLASGPLCQRVGFILDTIVEETNKKIPGHVFKYLLSRKSVVSRLQVSGSSQGKYNKKWNIQDNVGKEHIMGWWTNG